MFFILFSCGASPFLQDKKSSTHKTRTENIEGEFNLNTQVATRGENNTELSPYIQKLRLTAIWQVSPSLNEQGRLMVLLSDEAGSRSGTPLEFNAFLWMPTMGHGSFPITITKIDEGIYELTDIFFTMPGVWDIHFELINKTKIIDEVKWELNI